MLSKYVPFPNLEERLAYNSLWFYQDLSNAGISPSRIDLFRQWLKEKDIDLDYFCKSDQIAIFFRFSHETEQ